MTMEMSTLFPSCLSSLLLYMSLIVASFTQARFINNLNVLPPSRLYWIEVILKSLSVKRQQLLKQNHFP